MTCWQEMFRYPYCVNSYIGSLLLLKLLCSVLPLKSSIFVCGHLRACICALRRKCKASSKWGPYQAFFFPFVQVWLQVVLNFSLLRVREEHSVSLQDILSFSPFKTQAELLQEINAISSSWSTGTTGTRIIIWNLRKSVLSPHLQRCLLILEQHN